MKRIRCNYGFVDVYKDRVLKYIHKRYCSTFIMEVFVASRTHIHPHLSSIDGLDYRDDYFIMKLPRYHTTLNHTMDVDWFYIMWDIISGLVYLHNVLHIIHYDIKLDNVCLTEDKRAVLIDFGHARPMAHCSLWYEEYHIRYRPPECLEPHDGQMQRHYTSDIWALGIVWLEIIFQKEVMYFFSILYSHYKPRWWKIRHLKSITKKDTGFLSYEQTYFHLAKDSKEVYLHYLDLLFGKNELWQTIIRPMLRFDPKVRASALDTYCIMLAMHRQKGFKTAIPPLLTVSTTSNSPREIFGPGDLNSTPIKTAYQLIRNVIERQGAFSCQYPLETLDLLKRYLP